MYKKIISMFIILCMLISITACKSESDDEIASVLDNGDKQTQTENEDIPQSSADQDKLQDDFNIEAADGTMPIPDVSIGTGISTNANMFDLDVLEEPVSKQTESGYIKTSENNTSTFAADVDTASYSYIRTYLKDGNEVPKNYVRVEEMINYFNYEYGEPAADAPFAVATEVFDCPWNNDAKLVRLGLGAKQPDYESMPSSNIVFLIDVSGSMEAANKLPLVKQAFSMLSENLKSTDKISIVTYASNDQIVIEGLGADKQMEIQTAIENLRAGGGTYGSKGIITAYELAEKYFIEGGNNRVILATDGDLNIGITDTDELTKLITEKKESGVYLSVMGFGTDNLQDNKLESIADNGNGNYSYIDDTLEARRVLIEEMGGTLFTVAKDVKLQVEFNKDAVSEYRLIGYENRVMNNEDFEDDTKDGGEIGAGHRVTALYEIKASDINSDNLLTLNVRYKDPDGDKSILKTYGVGGDDYTEEASEDSVFAAAVAQFGMLLYGSEYVSGTYKDISARIENLECIHNDPYKAEFLNFLKAME